MIFHVNQGDVFGFVRHALDAHLLGIVSASALLGECGQTAILADSAVSCAFATPDDRDAADRVIAWLRQHHVAVLGLSYRLDPEQGVRWVTEVCRLLRTRRMLASHGGTVKAIFFGGLPDTCEKVRREVREVTDVFIGDETVAETLTRLGIKPARWPRFLTEGIRYDEDRLSLGRELTQTGRHLGITPVDRSGYKGFGTREDRVTARLEYAQRFGQPPLMRAHVGPFLANRAEAVARFMDWTAQLARARHLDVLSIGTSQLTQSAFGENWDDRPNGGGVPLNAAAEYDRAWEVSRPMLVRTYAGTHDIRRLAEMHERTLNIAWHALSLWWFCRIDGRGSHTVLENLHQHADTLTYVAGTNKPFEPNVAHHFSFRGADDVTAVAAAVLAARFAKRAGIRTLILQIMLNTPKAMWGVQDLAKARATLRLVRELEDAHFRVILQPRAGLDYFSHDPVTARAQLAAATMLMDDIEPDDAQSPPMIHVVSYSEASHLADPAVINESIQITRHALDEYRRCKRDGLFIHAAAAATATARTLDLLGETRLLLAAIEATVPDVYSAAGLHTVLQRGFLAVPHLLECRDEFAAAVQWQTRLVQGGVTLVDPDGRPMSVAQRLARLAASQEMPTEPRHDGEHTNEATS